ncbi:MAG: hypothetical protein V1765_03770 [bacterium]
MTAHYQYFIQPTSALATIRLNEMPGVECYDEANNLYAMPDLDSIKIMFKIKKEVEGTRGRNSRQPVDFKLWRRLGDEGEIKHMTNEQVENFLRSTLHLKPGYLQTAKLAKPKKQPMRG